MTNGANVVVTPEDKIGDAEGQGVLNALEPGSLVDAFLEFPPLGFKTRKLSQSGTPAFLTPFDLLTTLELPVRKILQKIPLFELFSKRFLRPLTVFLGTTVSEYVRVPSDAGPSAIVAETLAQMKGEGAAAAIIKDIPSNSPLLSESENAFANSLTENAKNGGFLIMAGQALAYVRVTFNSIDEYLAGLSSSRRKDMKRKLKAARALVVEEIETGDSRFFDDAMLEELYGLYQQVYCQSEIHFDELTKSFFARVLRDPSSNGILFLYKSGGTIIGFNLCFVHRGCLIDKYIGLRYPDAHDVSLYFVSWFKNLEYALSHRLHTYIAGWTDPEVKASLGAEFTMTSHAVYFRNPIFRMLLRPLRRLFEPDKGALEKLNCRTKGRGAS